VLSLSQIRMGRNDRAVLIGQTGTGKSTLAEFLLHDPDKRNSVAFDPKASETLEKWTGMTRCGSLDDCIYEAEEKEKRRIIFTPDAYSAESSTVQDRLFAWIYERGRTRLYIDEATALAGGATPSRYLIACLNRGRERGVSTLTATQRPARIPLNILSEAQHYYVFKVLMLTDQKRIEELTGIPIEEQATLKRFEYFYWSDLTGAYPRKLILQLGEHHA